MSKEDMSQAAHWIHTQLRLPAFGQETLIYHKGKIYISRFDSAQTRVQVAEAKKRCLVAAATEGPSMTSP